MSELITINETQVKGNVKVTIKNVNITKDETVISLEITNLAEDVSMKSLSVHIDRIIIQEGKQYSEISKTVESHIEPTVTIGGIITTGPISVKPFNIVFEVWDYNDSVTHRFVCYVEP